MSMRPPVEQFTQLPCDATDVRCKACANVADIDAKIERAPQNSMDMQVERLRLLSEVNQAHDQLSRRFPVEILANVFQHCISDLNILSECTDEELARVPLRLSQVCRRWRTICHSIPQLWTILPLYVKESQESSLEAICDVVCEWLGRSGEFNPLAIILDIDYGADLRASHCHLIFTTLKNYSGRIHHFQITASAPILRYLCYFSSKISTLRIRCLAQRRSWDGPDHHFHNDGCGTVEPEHLNVDGTSWTNFRISLTHLTHLEVQEMPFSRIFIILRDALHLISFKFADPSTNDQGPSLPPEPFIKPALKHLYLNDHVEIRLCTFILAAFTFPSLQSLVLESRDRSHPAPLTAVISHLRRSGSQLEILCLRHLTYNDPMQSSSLADLIGPVAGRSLRLLEISVSLDWFPLENCQKVAEIVDAASAYLSNLRTLRLYSSKKGWLYTLQKLLSASSTIISASKQPLSVALWFSELPAPIEGKTRDVELNAVYIDNNEHPLLTATELRDMMSRMKHHLISVTMPFHSWTYYFLEDNIYITEEVLVTLGCLLHNSRSKQLELNQTYQ